MKETIAATTRRLAESGGRDATELDNGLVRVLVSDKGGMVPELGAKREAGYLNAHWIPEFRSNSGKKFSEKDAAFWHVDLLYNIAGNFPCAPNFGPGHEAGGIAHPPHGWTANLVWKFAKGGIDPDSGAAYAVSTMKSPEAGLPLSFKKIDVVFPGVPVHYTSVELVNGGDKKAELCFGWHNTVGAPFLQAGCRLTAAAERWATAPKGGEFDDTGRLAIGAEFKSLKKAPLRCGKTADLTTVPGMIGFTDFATGPIPAKAALGWSAVANPALGLVYATVFPGPAAAGADGIALSFNDLWMQYGGRRFTPWAAYEGGADRTFCLGVENAVGAYANGLAYARKLKELMGSPTVFSIEPKDRKALRYGTLFAPYAAGALDEGVAALEAEKGKLVLSGAAKGAKSVKIPADADFSKLIRLESAL